MPFLRICPRRPIMLRASPSAMVVSMLSGKLSPHIITIWKLCSAKFGKSKNSCPLFCSRRDHIVDCFLFVELAIASSGRHRWLSMATRALLVDVHTHMYLPRYASLLRSRTSVPFICSKQDVDRLVILDNEPRCHY